MSSASGVAVVIPVLGDAAELDVLLAQLEVQEPEQIIVVSGQRRRGCCGRLRPARLRAR